MKTALVRAGLCAGLAVAAGLAYAADGTVHPEGPGASIGEAVLPVSGVPVDHAAARDAVGFDEAHVRPFPRLSEIPPMPMPSTATEPKITTRPDTLVMFDADTGEEAVMPATIVEGVNFARGGDDFDGMAKYLPTDLASELNKWSGTLSQQTALDSFPRSPNCKLAMRFTDVNGSTLWFVCSGAMNDAGVVVTSAHCIYARDCDGNCNIFDWAEEVFVFPGWDGVGDSTLDAGDEDFVYENFGVARGTQYVAYTSWTQSGSYEFEVATVRLNRFSGSGSASGTAWNRQIGMLTGWYAWRYGANAAFYDATTLNNYSYPAENCPISGLHNGRDMYYWFGRADGFDPGQPNQLRLNTSGGCFGAVWGGMSGSNMYDIDGDNRYVNAVASTSNRNDRADYARLWEGFVVDTLQPQETAQRGTTFDPELLQYRYSDDTRDKTVKAGTSIPAMKVVVANATNANPASQTYTLDIYLSSNNNISTSDRLIATWNYTVDFAGMQTITFNIPSSTLPADVAPGDYFVGAVLRDVSGEVTNTNNDTDTWDAAEMTVTLGNPDTPSYLSPANFATEVDPDANLDWSAAARATSYDVYFGTDPTPDAGEFQGNTASSFWSLPPLNLGTTYYWQIIARNSAGTTAGPVWRFTVEVPVFDLSANAFQAQSGTYAQGQVLPIGFIVGNTGNTASGNYNVDIYLSTNTTITVFDTLIRSYSFGPLADGSTRTTNPTSATIPLTQNPGNYFVGMIVSGTGDSDTSNNTAFESRQITIVNCPADIARPYGTLDIDDVLTFLNGFAAQDPIADVAPPAGVWDIDDVLFFLNSFAAGCP